MGHQYSAILGGGGLSYFITETCAYLISTNGMVGHSNDIKKKPEIILFKVLLNLECLSLKQF